LADYRLSKKTSYEKYFGIKCEYVDNRQLKFSFVDLPAYETSILSRSFKKLKSNGYIRSTRYYLVLTEKGIERAKEMLKVQSSPG